LSGSVCAIDAIKLIKQFGLYLRISELYAKKSEEIFDEDISSLRKRWISRKMMAEEIPFRQRQGLRCRCPDSGRYAPSPVQKIPAFVSLTKYKELRVAFAR